MLAVVLRLDAPWMSFGGVLVDHYGFTERFPGHAMLAGLLGNALGYDHADAPLLQELQDRLVYAARWDAIPATVLDYQTVDLGQPKMRYKGWTTFGIPDERKGGPASKGTHQRFRHYLEDGLLTIVLRLEGDVPPRTEDLPGALRRPARPLFLGRKACLPARPLLDPVSPIVEAGSLVEALARIPAWNRDGSRGREARLLACWPEEEGREPVPGSRGERRVVFDRREWRSQLPAGSTCRYEGYLALEAR